MERYHNSLIILASGFALGVIFFVGIGLATSFDDLNLSIAVGGTWGATGAFLSYSALPGSSGRPRRRAREIIAAALRH